VKPFLCRSHSIASPPTTLFRYIMPLKTQILIRIFLCERRLTMANHGRKLLRSQAVLPQAEMVCLAVLHSQGIHPKCCASLRRQKVLGHYLLSKALCQIMMELHGAREVRYMSPQEVKIMVHLASVILLYIDLIIFVSLSWISSGGHHVERCLCCFIYDR
jgi:hypothetical protein